MKQPSANDDPLNDRIGRFYDESTPLWLSTWGEHMHHGYYGPDGKMAKDNHRAQIDLIEALLQWGGVDEADRILDAGCGVGGSARYLALKFNAGALGLTLSPVQAEQGSRYNREAGLEECIELRVQDLMSLTPADGPFDLIWSLESAEHIADKSGMLALFHSLLAPGGRLLMATWCHRPTPPALSAEEERLLGHIYQRYHLPPMTAIDQLAVFAETAGFQQVLTADWTDAVAPFWGAVIRSALNPRNWPGLLQAGPGTLSGAWAMRYMRQGYRRGIIRFGVLRGVKAGGG